MNCPELTSGNRRAALEAGREQPMRWTAHRKMELVVAVRSGRLDAALVSIRYGVGVDELESWSSAFNAHGLDGLKVVKGRLLRRVGAVSSRREDHRPSLKRVGERRPDVLAGRS